ncbi:MAG TPA: LLM class F420-dependent oxidoreductase [Kouleothrix sp.]|uniref:LLM class F420-dependent oxidoreductase n=1 Tax=Kouleothrix sp. TaxID=2779161 RepID=UPI002B654404|nr:LLM class F420-dependent oxidoreductase [Kouleothrix sp.]HRC77298.1 LLM class F420-dependent oxidoreductase [Kouleothrix sp.]
MSTLRFGIKTAPQHTTYEAMLRVWQAADAVPAFEHAWLFDHFAPIFSDLDGPCFEGFTLLSALAAQTKRIRVGLMVAGNTYRHPAVLAHMGATIDVISGGRFDMGIGAGWNEYEHASMGLPLYAPGERIRRLGEACEIIKRLYTQHLTDFDGRFYQLKDARCEPKPVQKPYPPFVIGGGGEQLTLRVVAQYADVWNFAGGPPEAFEHKAQVLRVHCAAIGRDPAEIALSVQIMVNYENLDETAANLQRFVDLGATHLILNLRYPYPDGIVERVAAEVLPRVRA